MIALPTNLKPVADFTVQVVVGTVLFLLVFFAAALIAWVVHFAQGLAFVPPWLYTAATYAEMAVFAVDMVCYVIFLLSEMVRLIRELWLNVKGGFND